MKIIAGVDEVGRGSLIGPVYATAVILNKKINKFCYVSTIAAVGETTNSLIDEECEWKENNNPYQQSK